MIPAKEYKKVGRFIVKKGKIVKTSVTKTTFSQLNDKRFYFPNGILSFHYGHPSLYEIDTFNKEKGQKIENYFWQEKDKLLSMEREASQKTPRLQLFEQILPQKPKIVNLNQKCDFGTSLHQRKV